jgi:uncharacterized integral membrane protein
MIRLISAVVLTVAVVTFAMTNTHPVALGYVLGPPVQIPLIFLLLSAFFAGMVFLAFSMMLIRLRINRRVKQVTAEQRDLVKDLVKD